MKPKKSANFCYLDLSTRPPYRQSVKTYSFYANATNALLPGGVIYRLGVAIAISAGVPIFVAKNGKCLKYNLYDTGKVPKYGRFTHTIILFSSSF